MRVGISTAGLSMPHLDEEITNGEEDKTGAEKTRKKVVTKRGIKKQKERDKKRK